MTRDQFQPGIIYRIGKLHSLFKYEQTHNETDITREVGFGTTLWESEHESINVTITDTGIQLFTGITFECILMYSQKFPWDQINIVDPATLKKTEFHLNHSCTMIRLSVAVFGLFIMMVASYIIGFQHGYVVAIAPVAKVIEPYKTWGYTKVSADSIRYSNGTVVKYTQRPMH